jgi:hypothetical protein
LWASIGLGSSFLTGELQVNRVERYAILISNFTTKEQNWFVLARQFDSLAALQSVPGLDRSQRDKLQNISFELQTKAIVLLLDSIASTEGADQRVQALPFILPSMSLQLIEPSVDETVKTDTLDALLPHLIAYVEYAATTNLEDEDEFLRSAYGDAAHSASLLITRALGSSGDTNVIELWNTGDYPAILELVETWKTKQ